jgi:hypothetical protein
VSPQALRTILRGLIHRQGHEAITLNLKNVLTGNDAVEIKQLNNLAKVARVRIEV